jgi:hypothetical protein
MVFAKTIRRFNAAFTRAAGGFARVRAEIGGKNAKTGEFA